MTNTPLVNFRLLSVSGMTDEARVAAINENSVISEALYKHNVKSRTTSAPPGSPANGDCYIVASSGASGAWTGWEDYFVIYYNGWFGFAPFNGPIVYVEDDQKWVTYDSSASAPGWTLFSVGGSGSSFVGARALITSSQSMTPASSNIIDWDAVDYDTDSFWSAGNPSRLTAPSNGKYLCQLNIDSGGTISNGIVYARIRVNGSTYIASNGSYYSGTGSRMLSASVVYDFATNDYIEGDFFIGPSGNSPNIDDLNQNSLMMTLLG